MTPADEALARSEFEAREMERGTPSTGRRSGDGKYYLVDRETRWQEWLAAWTAARAGEGEYVRGLEAARDAVLNTDPWASRRQVRTCAQSVRALIDAARAEVKP